MKPYYTFFTPIRIKTIHFYKRVSYYFTLCMHCIICQITYFLVNMIKVHLSFRVEYILNVSLIYLYILYIRFISLCIYQKNVKKIQIFSKSIYIIVHSSNNLVYKSYLQMIFNDVCIPESFNTNISHPLVDYTITFVNPQHKFKM